MSSMSITGMCTLNSTEYNPEKIQQALDMLYLDRENEFRELSRVLLDKKAPDAMSNWRESILNFGLDVDDSFKTWSEQNQLSEKSPQKALILLRQMARGQTSMNQLSHRLNISCNLSLEFKEIYRRLN